MPREQRLGLSAPSAAGGGGAPSGAAGGDLGGTYPNPTVVATQAGAVITASLAAAAATWAKIQNMAAPNTFLGRITAGAGSIEELTAAQARTILGMPASDALTGDVTKSAGSGATTAVQASGAWALPGVISPTQLAANTDDWAPTGLATASVIRFSTDASCNLTGLTGGAAGREIILHNVGAQNLVLKHDVTSTAANRFYCSGDVDMILGPDGSVRIQYDGTSSRWRVVGHSRSHLHDGLDGSGVIANAIIDPFTRIFGAPFTACALGFNLSTITLVAARGYWLRVLGSGTITAIAVNIIASAGNIDIGVYANSGSGGTQVPGAKTRVASLASPGTGYRELALGGSTVVNVGDWFYLNISSATNTFSGAATPSGLTATNAAQFGRVKVAQTNGTVPDPAVCDSITPNGGIWMVGVA